MADRNISVSNKKIMSLVDLKKVLGDKEKNKSIALCHGVFDLMHIGHIKYLEDAKKYGDMFSDVKFGSDRGQVFQDWS